MPGGSLFAHPLKIFAPWRVCKSLVGKCTASQLIPSVESVFEAQDANPVLFSLSLPMFGCDASSLTLRYKKHPVFWHHISSSRGHLFMCMHSFVDKFATARCSVRLYNMHASHSVVYDSVVYDCAVHKKAPEKQPALKPTRFSDEESTNIILRTKATRAQLQEELKVILLCSQRMNFSPQDSTRKSSQNLEA